jgi:hypothetical protein
MSRNMTILMLGACLSTVLLDRPALAHGFGGERGFRGGGGESRGGEEFRGREEFRGGGEFRSTEDFDAALSRSFAEAGSADNGDRGSFGGSMAEEMARLSYRGKYESSRTPSFSTPGTFDRGRTEFRGDNPYAGGASVARRSYPPRDSGGRTDAGYRAGSYTTDRGTTIDHGAAGRAGVRPVGGIAGRGVADVNVTTANRRSSADVGRARGAIGPGGAAAGYRRYGASGCRPYGFNAYGVYHSGWVHGYWNGQGDTAWGWRKGDWGGWGWGGVWGRGLALGFGVASWGFGSALYCMGYMPYDNPYYGDGFGGTTVVIAPYDYGQPIDTTVAPASSTVVDSAMATFDSARASFSRGNHDQALVQVDSALKTVPNDTSMHEFRALCLFARKRYDEAAATLYAVLSVGPGWDWATMVDLYPDVEVYTAQLRALEDYCNADLTSAAPRFVLGYHYLTEGHTEAAAIVFNQVVALMPNDTLSAKLARQLDPSMDQVPASDTTASAAPATPPTDTVLPAGASIAGTWHANPTADIAIALTIQPTDSFTWQVTQKGKAQQFAGSSTFVDGLMTMVQNKGPAMVGHVSWKDATHMTFRVVGDGPDDPGLSFSK